MNLGAVSEIYTLFKRVNKCWPLF